MTIVVTVLEFPEGSPLRESSMTFSELGGTIGRTESNTWVLEDPERFLSGTHCKISCEQFEYFLTDTSTNGTFVNNSAEPLGKGNKVKLNSGDFFELSDYKFQVQVLAAQNDVARQMPVLDTPNLLDSDDPFAAPSAQPLSAVAVPQPESADPFASSFASALPTSNELPVNMVTEETDPLAALNKSHSAFNEPTSNIDPFASSNSYSDNANVANQAIDWPSAAPQGGLIPENWDDDLMGDNSEPIQEPLVPHSAPVVQTKQEPAAAQPSKPVTPLEPNKNIPQPDKLSKQPVPNVAPSESVDTATSTNISISESEARRRALEKENRKIRAELAALKKKMATMKKGSSSGSDTTLVDAIGFSSEGLGNDKIIEINEISGEFIRQAVEGLMQTLASRNNVKNTFRMNMTTIQPVENNPLKFSANVDDALENMFLKEGNSYKKPIETIQESFESIADHQVAILAGIRSAFKSIVNRFEPTTLETRFGKQNKRGLIPRNEKAKNWDAFHDYYAELFSDIDSSFQYLFGDEFSQAYEEQLQMLSHARKDKKSKH